MANEARALTLQAFIGTQEAKRRKWAADDEVARLRQRLVDAETAAAAATREYDDSQRMLNDVWQFMRSELESKDAPGNPPA